MPTPKQQRQYAWALAAFFFAGSVLSFVDRSVLGVVMPQVRKDLALSNTQYGLAVNCFLIAYMAFYVLGGRLADLLGSRRTFTLNSVFWSLAGIAHAAVRGLARLCVVRAMLGVGEGGFFPTAMRGFSEWFPEKNRAKPGGVLMCGISLGMVVTPPLVAWITLRYGWRAAFLVTGSLGFLLVPPWLWIHSRIRKAYGVPDPAPCLAEESAGADPENLSLRQVLARPKYWFFLLARAFPDTVTFFYLFWLPGYFQEVRHYDMATVGKLLWIPYFCADVGAVAGAWFSSALIARGLGLDRSRRTALLLSGLCTITGASAFLAPTHTLSLALASLALFGHFAWSSNMQTVVTEIMPRKHMATLYGLTGAAGTLLAALTQPLVGRAVDVVGYGPPFAGTAVAYLLALTMLLCAGKVERIR
jgi:ACS family hexuronate transporter-like MFS transporter